MGKLHNIMPSLFVDLPVASAVLVLALAFLWYMHKMHQRQLDDRQKELDRMAEAVRYYREMLAPFAREAAKRAQRKKP